MATLEQMYTPQAFSPQTALSQDIGASDTRIYVANVNVFPTPPTLATIGTDAASAETVKITAKGTNFIDVQRGLLGTAKSWTTNSVIARNFSAADQTAIQNNINTLNATKLESVEADDVVNNTLTNDKLAKVATNTLKGRKSVNQGNVEDLSASDVRAMLDIQKGADATNTVLEAAGDTTIADNDKLVLVDVSVSSGSKIRTVLWSAIKTVLNNLFVPKTRTVNKKALSENISLTAADVGAEATGTATSAVSNHNSDSNAHSSIFAAYVKNTLKINNKALSSDISLSANDVGADAQGSASSAVSSHNSASGAHETLFDKKQDVPLSSSSFPTSGTALAANTIYTVSGVGTYAFTAPTTGNKWAHGKFTTGSTVNVSFNGTFQGAAPSIEANKAYEFDVFDSVWAVQEVVSG